MLHLGGPSEFPSWLPSEDPFWSFLLKKLFQRPLPAITSAQMRP